MHVVFVEQLSLKDTGADKQGNQLTAEEHHYCFLHETLLQNKLKKAVGSLLIGSRGEKKRNEWAKDRKQYNEEEVEEEEEGKQQKWGGGLVRVFTVRG